MIEEELVKISKATLKAVELVNNGEFNRAIKTISRIKNSFCVHESNQAVTLIKALILLKRKKKSQARDLIYSRNYETWGSEDLQEVLRLCNPPTDKESKLFSLRIKGGEACFGVFTCFDADYMCDFEVVANSKEEAMEYISKLANFIDPKSCKILSCIEQNCPEDFTNRGVIFNSPFFRDKEKDEEDQSAR